MKAAALALGCLLLLAPGLGADEGQVGGEARVQHARQDLNAIRHAISKDTRIARAQTIKERDELGTLRRLNRELEAARRDALTHRHNLDLVRERLSLLGAAVGRVRDEEQADRAFLGADLAALYKARISGRPLLLLLSARDPAELGMRAHTLGILASATRLRVASLRAELAQLGSYRLEFDSRQAELRRRIAQVARDRVKVERERRGKEAQLRVVRGRRARALEAVRELKASADRLQGMLKALLKEARLRRAELRRRAEELAAEGSAEEGGAGTGAAGEGSAGEQAAPPYVPAAGPGLRRGLPWPVRGRIVSRFGRHLQPVFHIFVFNRGIEIAAPYGAPVRAVAAGTVDYAGELEGYGHLVVVDHGRGMMSVYGYGSKVLVHRGQVLRRGQTVEDVGEAAEERQPTLYFEILRGDKAQDPLRYLSRP